MSSRTAHVAVDLGATSGRVVLGRLCPQEGVDLQEVHRFTSATAGTGPSLVWDVPAMLAETLTGLARAARSLDGDERVDPGVPVTVGVTGWGVDAGVLGADGRLLAPVRHYRSAQEADARAAEAVVDAPARHARTGVLPQAINTAYRLGRVVADATAATGGTEGATVLLVPDLWTALLTGARVAERTSASTTGLVRLATGDWDPELVRVTGVDPALLPPVRPDGDVVGPLLDDVVRQAGLDRSGSSWQLVRVAGHDTASAALAVGDDRRTAFLSCGTWSLLGVARDAPVATPEALRAGLTTEAGPLGSWLLMHNLTGLWLLEQALRTWRRTPGRTVPATVPDAVEAAAELGPTTAAVDVTDPALVLSDDPTAVLRERCAAAGLPVPTTPAALTRCVLQSLALTYRRSLSDLERTTGSPVEAVRMVGGGTRIPLLARLTADACRRPVDVGPTEATSLGSVVAQALAVGALPDLAAARRAVARSVGWHTVSPRPDPDVERWWSELDAAVPRPSRAPGGAR